MISAHNIPDQSEIMHIEKKQASQMFEALLDQYGLEFNKLYSVMIHKRQKVYEITDMVEIEMSMDLEPIQKRELTYIPPEEIYLSRRHKTNFFAKIKNCISYMMDTGGGIFSEKEKGDDSND